MPTTNQQRKSVAQAKYRIQSEGRATGIPTIQDELRKNGSPMARIQTDDDRSYFLIEIPCREGFEGIDDTINDTINDKKENINENIENINKKELSILILIAQSPTCKAKRNNGNPDNVLLENSKNLEILIFRAAELDRISGLQEDRKLCLDRQRNRLLPFFKPLTLCHISTNIPSRWR